MNPEPTPAGFVYVYPDLSEECIVEVIFHITMTRRQIIEEALKPSERQKSEKPAAN
jgi:hypothetical protein